MPASSQHDRVVVRVHVDEAGRDRPGRGNRRTSTSASARPSGSRVAQAWRRCAAMRSPTSSTSPGHDGPPLPSTTRPPSSRTACVTRCVRLRRRRPSQSAADACACRCRGAAGLRARPAGAARPDRRRRCATSTRQDLDHRQVREVGIDADVHHRVVGYASAPAAMSARSASGVPGCVSATTRRALRARDVDRVEQRGHAADVRDRDHDAVRVLRRGRDPLQVVVDPRVGRKAEPEQARLQVAAP